MKKKSIVFFGLLVSLLFFFAVPTQAQAAPKTELGVTFYQDSGKPLEPNFVMTSGITGVTFTAVINSTPVPTDVVLHITGPNYTGKFDREQISTGIFGFTGTIPSPVAGNYSVRFTTVAGAQYETSSETPKTLGIHYSVTAKLSKEPPKIGDTNIRLSCTIHGYSYSSTSQPRVSVEGATIYSGPTYTSSTSNSFTLELGQITGTTTSSMSLLLDDVVVAIFPLQATTFPALNISPGTFYADNAQSINIKAMVQDYYYSTFSLRELENTQLYVELSGVPIAKSSVTGTPLKYENSYSAGEDVYRLVKLSASDLASSTLRFTGSGTLRMVLSSSDGRYETTVDLPVLYSGNSEGLIGAPAYQSYAGEAELNLQFSLPSSKPASEYTALVYVTGQDTIELHESNTSSYLYRMAPIYYNMNGKGTISVQATTVDRDYEQRDWSREFSFSVPSMELSQTIIPLNEEQYLSIFLRTADGKAINDATVVIEGVGSRTATSNGEYVYNTKWSSPGYKRVQAFAADGSLLADFSKMLKVQPPEVLLLEPDTESLLAGASQTVSFKIIDENGRELTGARVRAFVDGSSTSVTSTWNSSNKVYQVRVTPQQKVVFYAESSDGRKVSPELELVAVQPEAVCNLDTLTNQFMERLEISFIHPITGEALSGTMALRTQNVQIAERNIKNNTGGTNKTGSTISLDLYKRTLSGTSEPTIFVDFTYSGKVYKDLLTLPIGEAKITVTPDSLRQGVKETVTLEVKGAADKPLAGLEVELKGASNPVNATTNEQGKVSFSVTPASSEYIFSILRTDSLVQTGGRASSVEKKVPVGKATAPKLKIENIGDNNSVETDKDNFELHLEISDDDSLDYLMVNAQRVTLEGKTADRRETVRLSTGENKVTLAVYNKAGLVTTREIIIRYTPPVQVTPPPKDPDPVEVEPVVMHIGSLVVKQGATTLSAPPVAPKIINGRTMLPFRYLCQTVMKGTVDYVAATRTITTYVNGHEIIMQVNNPVITVDGVEYTLDQPPVFDGDNTMVPVKALERVVTYIDWHAATQTVTIYP